MLTKQIVKKEFEKEPDKYWGVELFKEKGFVRKQCEKCGKFFWTLQQNRKVCPDQPCSNYEFIGKTITKVKWDYIEAWKEFEKFFVKNGHISIKRYPVVSRWHPKLFFTIASIQDFQRIEPTGVVFEYPENPLIVPQISLRFNDIPNVGITGKHMTCFQMSGQHAFNDETGRGYWKDRCIELNFNFLTKVMGIPEQEVIYVGNIWAMPDFSAFGPCIESFSKGLEIVNSVLMQFKATDSGFAELPIKVIDVGWGHERLPWFTQGTPTVYEVAFGPVIEKLMKATGIEYDKEFFTRYSRFAGSLDIDEVPDIKLARINLAKQLKTSVDEIERKIAPLEAMFAIADHTKTLVFAITDGGIPSNVGGGYNLRVVLRRALSFIDKFKLNLKLEDVAFWHIDYLKKIFPELAKHKEEIATILKIEEKRYFASKERTKKIVDNLAKTGKSLAEEDLIKYYDSDGITPEQLIEAGLKIEIPPKFYTMVTEKHMGEKPEEEKLTFDVSSLPDTKILFYEKPDLLEFEAKVLKVFEENWVVLDQTLFYPESGGQMFDKGMIDGIAVENVQKIGNVILHRLAAVIKEGKVVTGKIDKERREILSKHHTATHIINASSRRVLGSWVWQHSASKDVDKARLDITHYEALTDKQVEKIEELANEIVDKKLPVVTQILPRNKAEEKYGFSLYQGGVPGKLVRVISVGDCWDHEACGGTHCKNTSDVGFITILRTKRIQDGAVRLEYCSGDVAIKFLEEKEKILKEVAGRLKVKEEEVPEAVEKLFKEWKKMRKQKRKERKR